jgi:hypothetical protein
VRASNARNNFKLSTSENEHKPHSHDHDFRNGKREFFFEKNNNFISFDCFGSPPKKKTSASNAFFTSRTGIEQRKCKATSQQTRLGRVTIKELAFLVFIANHPTVFLIQLPGLLHIGRRKCKMRNTKHKEITMKIQ